MIPLAIVSVVQFVLSSNVGTLTTGLPNNVFSLFPVTEQLLHSIATDNSNVMKKVIIFI